MYAVWCFLLLRSHPSLRRLKESWRGFWHGLTCSVSPSRAMSLELLSNEELCSCMEWKIVSKASGACLGLLSRMSLEDFWHLGLLLIFFSEPCFQSVFGVMPGLCYIIHKNCLICAFFTVLRQVLWGKSAVVPHLYCRFRSGLFLQLFSAKNPTKEKCSDRNNVNLARDLSYCCYCSWVW